MLDIKHIPESSSVTAVSPGGLKSNPEILESRCQFGNELVHGRTMFPLL